MTALPKAVREVGNVAVLDVPVHERRVAVARKALLKLLLVGAHASLVEDAGGNPVAPLVAPLDGLDLLGDDLLGVGWIGDVAVVALLLHRVHARLPADL